MKNGCSLCGLANDKENITEHVEGPFALSLVLCGNHGTYYGLEAHDTASGCGSVQGGPIERYLQCLGQKIYI
jgi:hypothetical protein